MSTFSEISHFYYYKTAIGKIAIAEKNNHITNIYFENDITPENIPIEESSILTDAANQITMYLNGLLKTFSLPLAPEGSNFQQKVWSSLSKIPYGETASYKNIALSVGNEKASRAVGMANNKNPIPIIIPCHRVIGSNGKLTGYRGGLKIKEYLLELETCRVRR